MREQSLKLSKYYEYKHVEYSYLQLIVTKSNRNINTEQIAILINKMQTKSNIFIDKINKKLIINQNFKVSFYIHITKSKVQFYFIVPKPFLLQFKTKCKEVWKNIEIKEVDCIPIKDNVSGYNLHYKYDDSLSLSVDKRKNDLLNSNMTIVDVLDNSDTVGVFYNFIPTTEKESEFFMNKTYKQSIAKYKSGNDLKRHKDTKDILIIIFNNLIDFVNCFLDKSLKTKQPVIEHKQKEVSSSTIKKGNNPILKNQIFLIIDSDREKELVSTMSNTFKVVNGNNELIMGKKRNINIKQSVIGFSPINKSSIVETNKFISMPSTNIIKQFNMVEHNKVTEFEVPEELKKGVINLGLNKCKEKTTEAFLSTDINLKALPLAIMGASRSGKSTFSINLCKNIIDAGEGLIVIDFIKNTELADSIKKICPIDRLIDIDLSKEEMIQSLCYNEIKITENMKPLAIVKNSRKQTNNILKLVDVVNGTDKELSPKMRKYLGSAARVGFCFNNTCMDDILNILQFHEIRHEYIDNLNDDLKRLLKSSILSLYELDDMDKSGSVKGTKDSKIEGILDRVQFIKDENTIIDLMFSKRPDNNIDFVDAMEQQKVILIRMRDNEFDDDISIDILTTFFLQKIWAALKIRGTMHDLPAPVTVLIDEVFQTPSAQTLLAKSFVQSAKFGLKYVLTLHYLQQLSLDTQRAMKNSNASYMLISGVEEQAFYALQNDFEKEGYTVEDLLNLPRYHSLNLVKVKNGKSAFITKLPDQIK